MGAMGVSFRHSAISSGTSEKDQGLWLRPSVQYAVQYLHVQQHAIFTLRRASVKAQAENHPLSKWDTHDFGFGVQAKTLG